MIEQIKILNSERFGLKRRLQIIVLLSGFILVELLIGTSLTVIWPFLITLVAVPLIVIFLLARLDYTPIALLVSMMLFSIVTQIGTGTESTIPLSLFVVLGLFLLWLIKMGLYRNVHFIQSGINLPALVFLVIVGLSMLWSRFLIDPLVVIPGSFVRVQLGTIGVTVGSVVTAILCANIVRRVGIIKVCFWMIVAGSLFYLPNYLYEEGAFGNPKFVPTSLDTITIETLSRIITTNGLFSMWVCALTLAILLNARDLPKWQRAILILCLTGWFFRLFIVTLVRTSGWLPTVIAIMVVLLLYSRKWFIVLGIIAAILLVLNFGQIYDATVVAKQKEGTLAGDTSRQSLWTQAFVVSRDHPLLGTGPAGYSRYYVTYYQDHALSTHNNYLDIVLQYGFLGLGAFLWLCFMLVRELWKSIRLQKPGTFERGFAIGAFAGACGVIPAMWLGDWFIPFAYNQTIGGFSYTNYNWLFMGLGLALGYIARERQNLESIKNKDLDNGNKE